MGNGIDLAEASLSLKQAAIRKCRLDWTEPMPGFTPVLNLRPSPVFAPRAFIRHHGNSADSAPRPGRHGQLFRSVSATGKGDL